MRPHRRTPNSPFFCLSHHYYSELEASLNFSISTVAQATGRFGSAVRVSTTVDDLTTLKPEEEDIIVGGPHVACFNGRKDERRPAISSLTAEQRGNPAAFLVSM